MSKKPRPSNWPKALSPLGRATLAPHLPALRNLLFGETHIIAGEPREISRIRQYLYVYLWLRYDKEENTSIQDSGGWRDGREFKIKRRGKTVLEIQRVDPVPFSEVKEVREVWKEVVTLEDSARIIKEKREELSRG